MKNITVIIFFPLLIALFYIILAQSKYTPITIFDVKWIVSLFAISISCLLSIILYNPVTYDTRNAVLLGLIFICFINCALGFLQFMGIIDANNGYRVTGCFGNPAEYATAQVAFFPAFILYSHKTSICGSLPLFMVMCLIIILPICFSGSRTAFLATLPLCMAAFLTRPSFKGVKLMNILTVSVLVHIAIVFIALLLIRLNQESVSGRLLIWKISLQMIRDKPLCGFGLGGFSSNYMAYQARYFRTAAYDTSDTLLADSVFFPYNEFIRLIVDVGFLGLCMIVSICYFLCRRIIKSQGMRYIGLACMESLIILSMFSFPINNPVIWLTYVIYVLMCPVVKTHTQLRIDRVLKMLPMAVCLAIAFVGLFGASPQQLYSTAVEYRKNKEYVSSIEVASLLDSKSALYDVKLLLAENYSDVGNYEKAKAYFQQARYMIPSRILPYYGLYKIANCESDEKEAAHFAEMIVSIPVKKETLTSLLIKAECQDYLNIVYHD